MELSARNTELAKRNKHHHHLGPSGYYAKEEQFRKMDEEAVAAGNIDVTNLKVRSRNWIYARSTESSGSNLKFDKPETQEAVSRILKMLKTRRRAHSILLERGTSLALAWETRSTQAAPEG